MVGTTPIRNWSGNNMECLLEEERQDRRNAIQESRCVVLRVYENGKEWTDGRDVDKEALKGSFQGLF